MVLFESDKKNGMQSSVSPADWIDWQKANVFADLAAVTFADYNLTGVDQPLKLAGYQVSANFFRTLGVRPVLGRDFTEAETTPGNDRVVILTHELWRD